MGPIYTHPIYKPISRSERWTLYREHPLHGVRVTYHAGRGEYLVVELEYFGSSDAVGRDVGTDLVTSVHSDITEKIDQIFESYLVPARLSEMMEEFVYRT